MAKTCMVNREAKRAKLVKKFAGKRTELKRLIADPKASFDVKADAQKQLQKPPCSVSVPRNHR